MTDTSNSTFADRKAQRSSVTKQITNQEAADKAVTTEDATVPEGDETAKATTKARTTKA